jgi:histidinol-phosphate/aromatic aminotransferase/cobyric acid decarboxylase-like protein
VLGLSPLIGRLDHHVLRQSVAPRRRPTFRPHANTSRGPTASRWTTWRSFSIRGESLRPSPKAAAVVRAALHIDNYPSWTAAALREKIASKYGYSAEQVICGAGETERLTVHLPLAVVCSTPRLVLVKTKRLQPPFARPLRDTEAERG